MNGEHETATLADVMAELQRLRAEVRELRQQSDSPTQPSARLVDAAALAAELGISRQWIYQHRDDLGAVRIGDGPKARLRFDIDTAREALGAQRATPPPTTTTTRQRRAKRHTAAGSILKVRS